MFVEEAEAAAAPASMGASGVARSGAEAGTARAPVRLADVSADAETRISTGIEEFDRVLGGGLVPGSVVLLGGAPGIGKSTLLLQAAHRLSSADVDVLYVCGEESPSQVRLRASRLGADSDILLLPVVDAADVVASARESAPTVLVVDSVQTLADPDLAGAPGGVGQVRASASRLVRLAKETGIAVVVVGHVTKEGALAGPRVLEHMVDTVLSFEGDDRHTFRVVRATKNRFGSVSEIGVFDMTAYGLEPVGSPSHALLAQRPEGVSGSVVAATVEGTRSVLVEIQALVTESYLDMPRRLATGVERSRLQQVLAVLEKRAGISFGGHDVYVSVAGGFRILEPAADLPLALALVSARRDVIAPSDLAAFGEIGLAGEVRPVPRAEARLAETGRMGMARVVSGPQDAAAPEGLRHLRARYLTEAIEILESSGSTGSEP